MRKIYGSAPDVPQSAANKAIDIVERHFAAAGVRRAEELSEEGKIRLLRSLQWYFESELPPKIMGKNGEEYDTGQGKGFFGRIARWFENLFSEEDNLGAP